MLALISKVKRSYFESYIVILSSKPLDKATKQSSEFSEDFNSPWSLSPHKTYIVIVYSVPMRQIVQISLLVYF